MNKPQDKRGVSRVKLAVVVVIIGMLAVFVLPLLLNAIERSKARQAVDFLTKVLVAQERYHSIHSIYSASVSNLNITSPAPRHFTIPDEITPSPTIGSNGETSLEYGWILTATRHAGPKRYGAYTVTFYEGGFTNDGPASIAERPRINPTGRKK